METEVLSGHKTLLQKYEIPLEHLDFEYLKSCENKKEVERIYRILNSKQEGCYPDLEKFAKERLRQLNPASKVYFTPQFILLRPHLTDPTLFSSI